MVEQPTLFGRQLTWTVLREPLTAVWRFLRHEILYLLWALMEISLLAPVFLSAMPWTRFWSQGIFALWLLLLMLIPFNLIRVMSLVDVPRDRQRLVLAAGLFLTILLSLRTLLYAPASLVDLAWLGEFFAHSGEADSPLWARDVAVFVIVCFIWWRGISLAGRSIDIGDIGVRFRFISLLLAILVGGIAASVLIQSVTPFILLFFLSSLMAIVLTRIEQLEMNQSGRSFPLGPRWVAIVALAAFLVVFLIGILAGVFGGAAVDSVVGWMAPLWLALEFMATAVIGVISYLSVPIILVLQWLLELLIGMIGPILQVAFENLDLATPPPVVDPQTGEELIEITSPGSVLPRQLITILSMTFFVLLISLAFSRLLRFLRPPSDADTELVNPLEGLSGRRPGFGRRLLDRLGLFRRWQAAASIRRIYQDMCSMAGSNGYPRLESETPYEYLKTLKDAWPENTAETYLITEAYNRIRYGELPETQEELDEIEAAWKRLEHIRPDGGQAKNELEIYARKEN
jgi:hypothetical protein